MSKPIKTRRLVLRELMDSDAPELARLAGDWDVARMTARIPYPYSEALAREWMATLEPGESVTFDQPFGDYLAPGVHTLAVSLYGGSGPQLWLKP